MFSTNYSFVLIVQDEFCIGIYDQDAKFWRQSTLNLDKILFIIIVILFSLTLGLAIAVFICTGKSLPEALIFAEHRENMLYTEIVLNVKKNF